MTRKKTIRATRGTKDDSIAKTIRSQRRFDEKLSLLSVSHPLYIIFASILSQSHKAAIIGLVIRNYGRSLVFGTRYIYESMPRLLTLWFDFSKLTGLNADGVKAQQSDLRLARLNQLHRIMQKFVDKLPPFQASHVQLCLPVFFSTFLSHLYSISLLSCSKSHSIHLPPLTNPYLSTYFL